GLFFFSSRRRHTRSKRDWSSDVCSSDLDLVEIDAGDTFAYDTKNMADQHEREAKAATRIFGLLPPDQAAEFRALWDEFEARATRSEERRVGKECRYGWGTWQ